MSQTTRCPSCATLFKVVPDQLRISDGWVRCGQCRKVFDATLSLQAAPASAFAPAPLLSGGAPSGVPGREPQPEPVVPGTPPTTRAVVTAASAESEAPGSPAVLSGAGGAGLDNEKKQEKQEPLEQHPAAPVPHAASVQGPLSAGYELPPALQADAAPDAEGERRTEGEAKEHWPADAASPGLTPAPFPSGETEKNTAATTAQETQPAEVSFCSPVLAAMSAVQGTAGSKHGASAAQESGKASDDQREGRANGGAHDWAVGRQEATALLQSAALPAPRSASGMAGEAAGLAEQDPGLASVSPSAAEPSFVRSARRRALWHKPAVRLALGGAALLLAAAMLAQVAVQQRHYLVSAQPRWRPALEALCLPLQCTVQPYRHIASVVVDSSSFNKLRGATYRLALALKNQSALEVALPAVELTLTDTSEQPLLRRVFTPAELAAPDTISSGGEWLGSLEMDLRLAGDAGARIAGYRVLLFYP